MFVGVRALARWAFAALVVASAAAAFSCSAGGGDNLTPDASTGGRSSGGNGGAQGGGPTINVGGGGPFTDYPTTLPASGETVRTGFNAADKTKLDGTPVAANAPTIAYPLPHSLFPRNVAPVEIHVKRTSTTQTLARIHFEVDTFKWDVYDTCAPAELDPAGCVLTLDASAIDKIATASQIGTLKTTVRLADASGGTVGEAALDDVAWTWGSLSGGLYYWSTYSSTAGAQIRRYDLTAATLAPEIFWNQNPDSPTVLESWGNVTTECMGCHAISKDGKKMALSFGGSVPGAFMLLDVATKKPLFGNWVTPATDPPSLDGTKPFASFTTFNPDGTRMINVAWSRLFLRTADDKAATIATDLFKDTGEPQTHPFWSPDGKYVVFVTFVRDPTRTAASGDASGGLTGDIVEQGQIWVAPSDGKGITGPAKVLVPREDGVTSFYPAASRDGQFIVFNRTRCADSTFVPTAFWSRSPCDGYDDPAARLFIVSPTGGNFVELAQANGTVNASNSWPRWSPDVGLFRGDRVMWIAFSSRRAYGLRLAGDPFTTGETPLKPQLWFSAIHFQDGKPITADPSYAPIWLPGQNLDMANPDGNHVPQWVDFAVPILH